MMPANTRRARKRLRRKALPVSPAQVARQRKGGMLRGKLRLAEDFDAPDPEIEKLFYEGDEP
jgi:hypothetical protein